jgi:manganese transport protein
VNKNFLNKLFAHDGTARLQASDFFKYIGPGFLVTIGFIDPGNWASDLAAGSHTGYALLWVVTLSTVMLIVLQHNSAHLGIVTGQCLAEATTAHLSPWIARPILGTAIIASIATAFAEILGSAIALKLLFALPVKIGAVLSAGFIAWMLFSNSYRKIERWIIGFVSMIGVAFIIELCLVHINWHETVRGWVVPSIPHGSMLIIISVLGAVVMPHNLFLHSEIIQSRQWHLKDRDAMAHTLKYEFLDTLISMIIGWAINSAIIILAASAFFASAQHVTRIDQAAQMLEPLLGKMSAIIFAIALLLAGISSTITAGIAGGTIIAGMAGESYDMNDRHTKIGVGLILALSTIVTFFITDMLTALIVSQALLSFQLPFTIITQIILTSSKKVMGADRNTVLNQIFLWAISGCVIVLNILLLQDVFK